MIRALGLVLAGALVLGEAAAARAQVAVSVGNPWTGRGVMVGAPGAYGYGYGAMPYGYGFNGVGYSGTNFVTPGWAYSSGYSGFATPLYGGGFSGAPYGYGWSSYSYPAYGGFYRRGLIGRRRVWW